MARPRQFDEEALLAAAADLFWTHGYAGTSIEDVARVTGLGNGSIYAAYGSKAGLHLDAVTHYCHALAEMVRSAMVGRSGDVAQSLRDYLELIICDCVDQPGRRGCLMLNSVALISTMPDLGALIDRTTRELEAAVAERLSRDLGTVSSGVDLDALAAQFVTLSQGLIQRSRLGHSPEELRTIADAAVRHLVLDAS